MVNKNQFSIKNTKKILHKVGKQWVVVSAILLGLVAGGTVATQTHINAQTNQSEQVQTKPNSDVTQRTSASNQATKSGVSNTGSPASGQASGLNTSSTDSSSVSSQSASSKASSSNQSNGLVASNSLNVKSTDGNLAKRNLNKLAASPNGELNINLSSMTNFQNMMSIVNDKVRANSGTSQQSSAVSGFKDLMNMASASNVKRFVNGAQLGEDTPDNSDTSTWIGEFNRAAKDINVINSNGTNKTFGAMVSNTNSMGKKLYNGWVSLSAVGNQKLSDMINHGYDGNLGKINAVASNVYGADTVANIFDNPDKAVLGLNGFRYGFFNHNAKHSFNADSFVQPFIHSELINKFGANNAGNLATVIRGLNTIVNSPSMSSNYDKVINDIANLSSDSNVELSKALNDMSVNIANIADKHPDEKISNNLTKLAIATGLQSIKMSNSLSNITSNLNITTLMDIVSVNKDNQSYNDLMTMLKGLIDDNSLNVKNGITIHNAYNTLNNINNTIKGLKGGTQVRSIQSLFNSITKVVGILNDSKYKDYSINSGNIARYMNRAELSDDQANNIIVTMNDLINVQNNNNAKANYRNVFDGLSQLNQNDVDQSKILSSISDNLHGVINNANLNTNDKVSRTLNKLSLATKVQAFKQTHSIPTVSSLINIPELFNVVKDNDFSNLMNTMKDLSNYDFNRGVKFSDIHDTLSAINGFIQGTDKAQIDEFTKSTIDDFVKLTDSANDIYSNYTIKAGSDINEHGTIAHDLAMAGVTGDQANKVILAVGDMAKITANPQAKNDYQNVFTKLSQLSNQDQTNQANTLNDVADSLRNVVNNAQLSNDKVGKDLNKLALLANVKAFKLQGNIPAISSVINVNNLMKVIGNKDNATAFNNLMDSLDNITSLDFTNGERFSNVNAKLQSVNSAVQQLSNVNNDVKSKLASVASMANDANSIYRDRLVKAGSNVNNPDTITYDVAKAGIPQTQAHDLITMVNDMASIEKDPKVNGVYHNIFTGLKSLPGQNESYQANKLNAVSKDLDIVANGLSSKDKVTDTLVNLSGETENAANSLVANEISGDADLVKSDASKIPSANSLDSDAINSDKAVVNSASTMINGIPFNSDYSELGNAEKAVNSANGALQDALVTNSSAAVQSYVNSTAASVADKSIENSIASSAAKSADSVITSNETKAVSDSVSKANDAKAKAAQQSANSSIANSYQDSVANSVSTANSKVASSAAQSADQSIANSNSLSASQSASQSYNNSVSASRSASLSQAAQDAYNNSLTNSYNSSVSTSKIAASSSAAAQSRAQSMRASQSAAAQSAAAAKARQASQAANKARKARAARTAKRNAAKRRRSVNNARKAFRRAKTRRAKRAAARRLRKAQANYKRAQKAMKRTNSKPAPKPTVKKAAKQVNTTRRNVNRARQAVKRARTRRAKRAAMRILRRAQARYNTATKQLKTVRHQKAVKAAYNKLERATKHGSRRARRRARRKLSQVNNAKKAIAKLRHRRNSKRNRRALRRANAKLAKVQRAMLK